MSIEPFPQRTRHHQPLPDGIARPARWAPIPASCSSSSHTGRQPYSAGGEQQQGMRRSCSLSGCVSSWQHGWPTRVAAHLCQPVGAGSFTTGGAFHPLIRFACALENGHQGEQAAALAAWQCRPLRVLTGQRAPVQDIGTLPSALAQQWEGACWQGEWITKRLRQVTDAPTWASGLPSGVIIDLLVQLANAALAPTGRPAILPCCTW